MNTRKKPTRKQLLSQCIKRSLKGRHFASGKAAAKAFQRAVRGCRLKIGLRHPFTK